MAEDWKKIKDAALATIREEFAGFLENQELDEYAKKKAELYAKEWFAAETAVDANKKKEHLDNLAHLKAQVKGEMARLTLGVSAEIKNTAIKVIETVGGLLLRMVTG